MDKLLEVYHFENKMRLGCDCDGGYVICKLEGDYDCYISCGVANEASFDRDFLNLYKFLILLNGNYKLENIKNGKLFIEYINEI